MLGIRMIERRYQTFGRRFGAGFIDGLVFLPLAILAKYMWTHAHDVPGPVFILWFILHLSAYRLYYILLHGLYGQTIGKRATGVIVIDKSETKPMTISQAIRRDIFPVIMYFVAIILFVPRFLAGGYPTSPPTYSTLDWIRAYSGWAWFLTEIITMLLNNRRRALHDFIAGTVVVRKESLTIR